MPRGGSRANAGRPKGKPNILTQAQRAAAMEGGISPLEYMLSVLRSEDMPPDARFEAAKAAAPYVHPKLAAIEHTGKDGGPIETKELSDLERAQALALLLGKLKNR